jgi:hypothetical protein
VKITLNTTSIPEDRRPEIEALAKSIANRTEIVWLPSRFPRIVMLVEPGSKEKSDSEGGSIFDSPEEGMHSLAAMTECLEERIKHRLAGPVGGQEGKQPAPKSPAEIRRSARSQPA